MSTAIVSWTEKLGTFPAGTVAGGWSITIAGDAADVVQVTDPQPVSFELNPGSYTVTVTRLDNNGAVLGAASSSFVIGEPVTVTVSIPDQVNVSVA